MNHWTIGRRILAGGSLILAMLILVGIIASIKITHIRSDSMSLRDDAIPGMAAVNDLEAGMFLGHIRALMAASAESASERSRQIALSEEQRQQVSTAIEHYESTIVISEDRQNFDKLKELRSAYIERRSQYLALVQAEKAAEAKTLLLERVEPAFRALQQQILLVSKWNADYGKRISKEAVDAAGSALWQLNSLLVLAVVTACITGGLMVRSISRSLRGLASSLTDASEQVASAATQVARASQTLAHGASEQAAALEETSASVEELSSMAARNSESAGSAQSLALDARNVSSEGAKRMNDLVKAMHAIKSSSDNIAKVVKTIDEIAFQTNILALNAAVEAARAGEAGAGFAVVADEVRSLAQRAAAASRETATMIENSIQTTDAGAKLTEEVAASLSRIDQQAGKVGDIVTEITSASREQSQGLGQINTGISQMDKVTQSNASNAEETAAAAEELSAQSVVMKDNVAHLQRLVG